MAKKAKKEVAVVLPTFNQKDITFATIKALQKQTVPHEVIVVDNGSTDGTYEYLTKKFDDIIVLKTKANYGGGGAQNIGCHYAYDRGYKWIIASDNDAVPVSKNLLEELIKASSDKVICHPLNIADETEDSYGFLMAHYTCYSRKVLSKIGFMFFDYFIYYDDIEYAYRAEKFAELKKLTNVYYSHPMKKSYPPNRFYFTVRNSLHTFRIHQPLAERIMYSLAVPNLIFVCLMIGESGYAKYGLIGIKDYLFNIFNNKIIRRKSAPNKETLTMSKPKFLKKFGKSIIVVSDATNRNLGFKTLTKAGRTFAYLKKLLRADAVVQDSLVSYRVYSIFSKRIICIDDIDEKNVVFREYKTANFFVKALILLVLNLIAIPMYLALFIKIGVWPARRFSPNNKYDQYLEERYLGAALA